MTTRRGFFAFLASVPVLSLFFGAAVAESPIETSRAPTRKIFKRLFRRRPEDQQWAEIAWDDARPGDHLLCIDIVDGLLTEFEAFVVTTQSDPNDPEGAMKITHLADMLPRAWGRVGEQESFLDDEFDATLVWKT